MNRTVFNEYGEPMGTERIPDADEQYDLDMDNIPDYDIEHTSCYFCNRDLPLDCMIPFEILASNDRLEEVFACGHCEHKIDDLPI